MIKKIFKKPWYIIIAIFLITLFFSFQLPNLKINNEVKIFLPDNHTSKLADKKMEKIFGSSDVIAVGINFKEENIFTRDNINFIKNLTENLSNVKNIDEITSITNSDYIEGTAEGMKVEELSKNKIQNKKDVFDFKRKVLSWDIYNNNLYNDDFSATQLMVKTVKGLSIEQKEEIYWDIKEILSENKQNNLKFYIAGMPAVNVLLGSNMVNDLNNLIPFVIAVVLLALYLSFKNLGGVVLPTLTVIISTIWALGIMALFGISLTIVSTVIPVLLVAVGSAYGIHFISHYYDDIRSKINNDEVIDNKDHKEIVFNTVKKVGKPIFLAGLTTMVGFGSLGSSNIMPIKAFGIFTSIGVGVALLVAVTLIPSILLVRHKRLKSKKSKKENDLLMKIITFFYNYFSKNRIRVLIFALVIVIISVIGTKKIIIDSVMVEMFKKDTEIRKSDKYLNKHFSGTNVLNVLVSGKKQGSLTNPEILKEMEGLGNYLKNNFDEIGKVTSFADFIKRMNKVMNYPSENNTETKNNNSGSLQKQESTSSFGSESTSSFKEEDTSSFGSESTSDFGSENTSSFGSSEKKQPVRESKKEIEKKYPTKEKISEKEFVKLVNDVLVNVNKTNISADEFVKLINKELNYKGEAYNEIPYDVSKYAVSSKKELKNLISQYLLMYAGSLDDLINDQLEPSKARMMIQVKTGSNIVTKKIENAINKYVKQNFPEKYSIEITGAVDMALAVNNLIVTSQIKSILISLIAVFFIVSISYKSFVSGVYGVIPLSVALLVNFGLMGFVGIKLDIATAMVASIAIGIGVDYTVHFLSSYHHNMLKTDDTETATKNTLFTTGKAIIFNALSVAGGFAVLIFSNFIPLVNLGLLVSVTMLTSSMAAMTLLPALLNLFKPNFINKK